jgi:hypothetical protein
VVRKYFQSGRESLIFSIFKEYFRKTAPLLPSALTSEYDHPGEMNGAQGFAIPS